MYAWLVRLKLQLYDLIEMCILWLLLVLRLAYTSNNGTYLMTLNGWHCDHGVGFSAASIPACEEHGNSTVMIAESDIEIFLFFIIYNLCSKCSNIKIQKNKVHSAIADETKPSMPALMQLSWLVYCLVKRQSEDHMTRQATLGLMDSWSWQVLELIHNW